MRVSFFYGLAMIISTLVLFYAIYVFYDAVNFIAAKYCHARFIVAILALLSHNQITLCNMGLRARIKKKVIKEI